MILTSAVTVALNYDCHEHEIVILHVPNCASGFDYTFSSNFNVN